MLIAICLGAVIGFVMALTGAGGGILAIPLLVFGLHLPVQQAAPVGLVAVGLAAALNTIFGLKQGIVRYRAAALMGGLGMLSSPLGVYLAQRLPNRPLLILFAIVLAFVAWRMVRDGNHPVTSALNVPCHADAVDHRLSWSRPCARALAGTGLIAGLLSGLLGVGGGFVIIPALKRYTDLDIRSIQATSLAVIALVSLSGVSAAAWYGVVAWDLALSFSAGAVIALWGGRFIAQKLSPHSLHKAFAWLCLVVALLLFVRAFS